MRRRAATAVVVAALVAALGTVSAQASAPTKAKRAKVGLKRFGTCGQVMRHGRRDMLRKLARRRRPDSIVDEGFLPLSEEGEGLSSKDALFPISGFSAPGRADGGDDAPRAEDSSTTNVQEPGVDEPDLVKSDGSTIFALRDGELHALDARAARPRVVGSLRIGDSAVELLIRGERALVFANDFEKGRAQLSEVDIADPTAMRVLRTLRAPGRYVSARLTGSSARVVLSTPPRGGTFRRRAAVRRSRLSDWVPYGVTGDRTTGLRVRRRLVGCRAVSRPAQDSGLGMLTVLTIDMDKGLPAVDADSVMTEAETVYASPRGLYLATERRTRAGPVTTVHKFAAFEPGRTEYRGSGDVLGRLLNQFALSEQEGKLRVASTAGRDLDLSSDDARSYVTVLAEHAKKLVRIGRVGDLGPRERIYSVRFIGDVGYVVTFRQVDPLYTLDLSKPRRPRVLGQLKIRGYSAYLHPVGEDLLLGVGQDASRDGAALGTQLSLFDVSNLRRPTRLHRHTLPDSSSEVEYDHRAFLYWQPARLAVLPVEDPYSEKPFAAALGFRIDRSKGIAEAGRISHRDGEAIYPIRRSVVVGKRLFTVSGLGFDHRDLNTLGSSAFAPFPTAHGGP